VDKVVNPATPEFLTAREVATVREHEVYLPDAYEEWDAEAVAPDVPIFRTTTQLRQQLEARARSSRVVWVSIVGGLTLVVAAIIGCCWLKWRQMTAIMRCRGGRPRTPTVPRGINDETPREGGVHEPPQRPAGPETPCPQSRGTVPYSPTVFQH
jgi:hypothetical protein